MAAKPSITIRARSGAAGSQWERRQRGRFGGLFDRYHLCAGDSGDTQRRDVGEPVPPDEGLP